MNNVLQSIAIFLITIFAVFTFACDEGGSSKSGGAQTGLFTKEAVSPGTQQTYWQMLNNNTECKYMMIYLAEDIKASGMIKSISFKIEVASGGPICAPMTIKMGHTSKSDLSDTTFGNNVEEGKGTFKTVLDNATVTIPKCSAGEYFSIPLTTSFSYNGVDNLVVQITRTAGLICEVPLVAHTTDGSYTCVLYRDGNGAVADTTGYARTDMPDTRFAFAGGDNSVYETEGAGRRQPFNDDGPAGRKIQVLYSSDEINGSGLITGIALQAGTVTTAADYTINVKAGHTALDELADGPFAGSLVTVANNATFNVPAGMPAGAYIWLPLPESAFSYNGTDNLIIEVETLTAVNDLYLRWSTTGSDSCLLGALDSATGDAIDSHYAIKLRFYGGTVNVTTPGDANDAFPFCNAVNNKSQYLYLASELGTRGSITKVAFRLIGVSAPSEYNSFQVVLGHTTSVTLGTTFSANMTGAQTVYDGTFSIPAGLKAGDWIEIPLSPAFIYDSCQNLVVEASALSGTENNMLTAGGGSLYNDRHGSAESNTTDTAGVNDFLKDMQLKIQ